MNKNITLSTCAFGANAQNSSYYARQFELAMKAGFSGFELTLYPDSTIPAIIEAVHQSLVGSDDVLACLHSGTDEFISRMQTAHSLDDGIDGVVLQNLLKILGDLSVREGNILQTNNLGDLNIFHIRGDVVNTSAHNAETK